MDFKINEQINNEDTITETLPVPMSPRMKESVEKLKRIAGTRAVNKKIREFFEIMLEENKDKLQKAG